ncbi:hypothetical protein VTH8203_03507 [Vibrio thalassae]|uniref:Uncharacterized protein n=1 Tax=Vibrio thalassae TaxID=1243014 RepID=A0A240EP42_9VIBR|nr:hypothetical protein [Vibrio thalassae]SNX49859.1 hypothetical protein VTH8203_03507 [Vibrio thalassae]
MSNSNKPKNVDFGTMERKLREMGVSGSLEHLKASKAVTPKDERVPQELRSTEVMATASSRVVTTNEIEQERQPSDWCNYIFGTLLSIYESTWIKSYGRRPTGRFLDFADSLTEAELMRVMQHCRERLQAGEKWPPIMGELTLLKTQLTESESLEAMNRVINKEPNNQLEKWIMQNKGYELRRLPQSMIVRRFKEFYREAMSLQEKGKLVTELPKGLAQHSVKNLVDLKREEFEQQHGTALDPRIAAILNKGNREQE